MTWAAMAEEWTGTADGSACSEVRRAAHVHSMGLMNNCSNENHHMAAPGVATRRDLSPAPMTRAEARAYGHAPLPRHNQCLNSTGQSRRLPNSGIRRLGGTAPDGSQHEIQICLDFFRRVEGAHERLADQHGVGTGFQDTVGVVEGADAGFGNQ